MATPYIEATTLGDLVPRGAHLWPDQDAVVFPDTRRTYRELWAGAEHVARGLIALGVRPGDHVGILMANCIEFFEAFFGAAAIGAVVVPINSRYRALELAHVVADADLVALITSDLVSEHVDHVERIREGLPELRHAEDPAALRIDAAPLLRSTIVLGRESHDGFLDRAAFGALADTVDPGEVETRRWRVRLRDVGMLMYSSGTTAHPKGCVITHEAIVRNGIATAQQRFGVLPGDRFWDPMPLFHMSGMLPLVGVLAAGAAYLCMVRVDAAESLEFMEREQVTLAFPSFAFLAMEMINDPTFPYRDFSQLRILNTSGEPETLRKIQAAMPHVTLINPYGCTEVGGVVCFSEVTDIPEQRATLSGRPLAGMEVRIVDPMDQPVEPWTEGEIVARGYALLEGYYKDPEKTAAAIDEDGWFHTGDLGVMDPEGRVGYRGRLKDMLKVGGENVAALEIEDLLAGHPAVAVCQVVGRPDERLAEVPVAFVELVRGAAVTEQELIDFCVGKVASFKVPREVRFVTEWPMSATKIQKFRLRELLAGERAI
jgi:fatty-acyl-CoA synthase